MTAAGPSKEKEIDKELVQKIIYKLKSQGYFDQYRKEFISDVDTKPAYKNLQQRVESYVSRFLSQQKWSPDLNKNNLRETLRRQINQTGMLNKGVERIVEQVVNPKILQIIKPKVDEVTCDHLGISLEARNSEIKRKQLEQQEKMLKSPDSAGIPSLISLPFNSPPPGSSLNPAAVASSSGGQFGTPGGLPGSGLLGPAPAGAGFNPQPPAAHPFSNPAGLTFPGISQHQFPFLPPGWNASMSAGFPPMFPPAPGMPPFQNFSIPPPSAAAGGITVPPPVAAGITMPPTSSPMVPAATSTMVSTRPSPAKGLNALLGLPTPSEEPPPPGTLVLPDGTKKNATDGEVDEKSLPKKVQRMKTESESYESSETEPGGIVTKRQIPVDSSSENELPYIPLPEGPPSSVTKDSADNQTADDSRNLEDFDTEDEKGEDADGKRPYKFAWNEEIEIDEDDVNESDVSSVHTSDVSSVHTSDLSNFEESDAEASKEAMAEEFENKLMLLQNEEGIGHVEEMAVEVSTEDFETQVEEVEAEEQVEEDPSVSMPTETTTDTVVVGTQADIPEPQPSPIKQGPTSDIVLTAVQQPGTSGVVTGGVVVAGGGAVGAATGKGKPSKPRKLLSLQYNYSDSEDEETREERKARIAKEKEERYQKRLQRRAELEAKRKEREEERARQKREKMEKKQPVVKGEVVEKRVTPTAEIDMADIVTVEGEVEGETIETEKEPVETMVETVVEEENKDKGFEEKVDQEAVNEDGVVKDNEEKDNISQDNVDHEVKEKGTVEEDNVEKVTAVTEENVEKVEEVIQESVTHENQDQDAVDKDAATDEMDKEKKVVEEEVEQEIIETKPETAEKKETVQPEESQPQEATTVDTLAVTEPSTVTAVETIDTSKDHDTSVTTAAAADTSTNTSIATTESSSAPETSFTEVLSSPEKKAGPGRPRKKTKAELKAELKEQKVQARKSQRQRVRNKKYMSDEFVFKSPPESNLSQSYDETMLVEETVEMEISTEPHTVELGAVGLTGVAGDQIQLLEIPLPGEAQGQQAQILEVGGYTIAQDGAEVMTVMGGEAFVTTDGQQCVEEVLPASTEFEVTQTDTIVATTSDTNRPATRQRSRENLRSGTSSIGDQSVDTAGTQEGRKKRKRNVSQSSGGGEPGMAGKKASPGSQAEKRHLRSSDRYDRQDSRPSSSRQSYHSEDLYKPRHSYSRRASSPPPLPSDPPPPPSDIAPPPLPPSPPPTDATAPPPPPESPPVETKRDSRSRRSRRKRKSRSRSRSRSPKRRKRSRSRSYSKPLSISSGSLSSVSKHTHESYSESKSSYSRKRSKSRSLSSISSDSRSRSYSKSRSYSRSRSRSRSSSRSRSRSVSRSRSRSISSISSKRSSFSDSNLSADERERRRKARPVEYIDFGEAAKRARQDMMMQPFPPRGGFGGHMGHMGPRGPGPYPMRGMSPMQRGGPRGMIRSRYPSPHHLPPDVPPVHPPPGLSPSKAYYPPPAGPRYMPPGGPGWEDMHGARGRQPMYGDDDYYPPDDLHEGPGKTGITERGTLYREDTSPSPPPERRPVVYTPPPYREESPSPLIPTGITERGTLYREDTSPSPPPLRRRRMEQEPSPPPPSIRGRLRPTSPSPPPISRRRTISARSGSFESISPSPSPPLPPLPPEPPVMIKKRKHRVPSSPEQLNAPPVLRRSRGPPVSTPSPPSSGELTPSPPDLSHTRGGASPVSPTPMYPASPGGPASPLESLTPSPPPPGRERLQPVSPPFPPSPPRLRHGHALDPASPGPYSPEEEIPPRLRRSSRNISSSEEEMHFTRSRRGQPPSPPPAGPRGHRRSMSPGPVVETRSSRKSKSKKHKRR